MDCTFIKWGRGFAILFVGYWKGFKINIQHVEEQHLLQKSQTSKQFNQMEHEEVWYWYLAQEAKEGW